MDDTGTQWKASQFNEYLGELKKAHWVIYNNLSGAMIEVKKKIYDALRLNNPDALTEKKHVDALHYAKFIALKTSDEVDDLKKKKKEDERAVKIIGLQIIPTLRCNFACSYCFQKDLPESKSMPRNVMEAVISHVATKIKPSTKYLNVMWFGGEPTLGMDSIRFISKALTSIAEKNGSRYFAGIITNGFLLNKRNVALLLDNHVDACQVTLDGPQIIHDKRRILRNGGATWHTIVDNLKHASSMGMKVFIRMNLDKSNISSAGLLVEALKSNGIFHKDRMSFGIVTDSGKGCKSIEDQLLTVDKAKEILKVTGVDALFGGKGEDITRAIPDFTGCVATAKHSLIVGPDGDIYKCSKLIGIPEEQCGSIFESAEEHRNFKKWLNCHSLEAASCRSCSMLPICRGDECAFPQVARGEDIFNCNKKDREKIYIEKLNALYFQKQRNLNLENRGD
ncbi:MAG: radical SAM protein [bacterium]|nr:radical SAM protein [bacterium]